MDLDDEIRAITLKAASVMAAYSNYRESGDDGQAAVLSVRLTELAKLVTEARGRLGRLRPPPLGKDQPRG